jgi:lipoprotein-releasing system permease protein
VFGVGLGVAALIIVLSVLNGFFEFVRDMLVAYDPHIRIVSVEERGIVAVDSLEAIIQTLPGVTQVSAYVEGKAMLRHDSKSDVNRVVVVRGIDMDELDPESRLITGVTFGAFDVSRKRNRPGIVVGRRLGERMSLAPGGGGQAASRVALLSAPGIMRSFVSVFASPPVRQFEVRGLFQLESVYDESYVFIDLREAQQLFRTRGAVSGIELRLNDLEQADEIQLALQAQLDPDRFLDLTWYDLQKSLYDVMRLEKYGASLVLVLIILVAAFNIVGSLTMIVIEKRRDVGALRTMGATARDIKRIFLIEGFLIGIAGSGAGLVIGLGLSLAQKYFEFVPLAEAESFLIDAYPVSIQTLDVVVIALTALLLCVLASVYPAWRAASIQPAEAVNIEA